MAILYESRLRAFDSSGNPLVGATLTINIANTATPAAIFTDVLRTVPMTNPTTGADKSDAAGWFPQIFAAESVVVDITLKNAAGVVQQTYVDVAVVGADDVLARTLPNGARLSITDAAGIVKLEVGD